MTTWANQSTNTASWSGGVKNSSSYTNTSKLVLDQSQTTVTDNPFFGVSANQRVAQSFKPTITGQLQKFVVQLGKSGTPSDNVVLSIYSDNSQPNALIQIADNSIAGSALLVGFGNQTTCEFTFSSGPVLTAATTYWALLSRSGSLDESNFFRVFTSDDNPDKYTRGDMYYYNGSWQSFTTSFGSGFFYDFYFKQYYSAAWTNISEAITSFSNVNKSPADASIWDASIQPWTLSLPWSRSGDFNTLPKH